MHVCNARGGAGEVRRNMNEEGGRLWNFGLEKQFNTAIKV